MTPHYAADGVVVHRADCIELMRTLPDSCVDSIVCDPPYGLGFMGKGWDDLPPGLDWAKECLRVLKPGGHILAFGGTRTWHRLAVAVEDAGFEIRDSIAWMYGSGFPKSLDVSKAIDKARVEDREPTRVICRAVRASMDARGLKSRDLTLYFGDCNARLIDHWAARDTDSQPALPKWEQWESLVEMFGELAEHDAEVWRLNGRKGRPGDNFEAREVLSSTTTGRTVDGSWAGQVDSGMFRAGERTVDITAPATPDAERWQGWGTALKPAFEPVVVGRKPLIGTVAANVLAHGTGGLNIDASRIGMTEADRAVVDSRSGAGFGTGDTVGANHGRAEGRFTSNTAGRWPANVVLDESQAAALDEQSGTLKSGANPTRRGSDKFRDAYGEFAGQETCVAHRGADSGGASRFFYVAKAPTKERPKIDGVAHPTVKPLTLMRWLVRLVTPPGGVVLEPFAGSGTTVEACILEGFRCIAIEREAEYLPLILDRIGRATEGAA